MASQRSARMAKPGAGDGQGRGVARRVGRRRRSRRAAARRRGSLASHHSAARTAAASSAGSSRSRRGAGEAGDRPGLAAAPDGAVVEALVVARAGEHARVARDEALLEHGAVGPDEVRGDPARVLARERRGGPRSALSARAAGRLWSWSTMIRSLVRAGTGRTATRRAVVGISPAALLSARAARRSAARRARLPSCAHASRRGRGAGTGVAQARSGPQLRGAPEDEADVGVVERRDAAQVADLLHRPAGVQPGAARRGDLPQQAGEERGGPVAELAVVQRAVEPLAEVGLRARAREVEHPRALGEAVDGVGDGGLVAVGEARGAAQPDGARGRLRHDARRRASPT